VFALGGFIATYISISNELKISVYLGILFALDYVLAILIHKHITFNIALIIVSALFLSILGGLIANQIRLRYDEAELEKHGSS
jgi:hypothetical protein